MLMGGAGMPGGGGGPKTPPTKIAKGIGGTAKAITGGINEAFRAIAKLDAKAMIMAGIKMGVMVVSFMIPMGVLIASMLGLGYLIAAFAPENFITHMMSMVGAIGALVT